MSRARYKIDELPVCPFDCLCFAKTHGRCAILNNTEFGDKRVCPFYQSPEARRESRYKAEDRIYRLYGVSVNEYIRRRSERKEHEDDNL